MHDPNASGGNASGEINVAVGSGPRDSLVIRFEIAADRALLHEPERSVLCDEILQLVALHLARRAGAVPAPLAARKLERARSLIERSLAQPLHVDDLAAAAHMSPFHFSRLFKLATGQSPHAYLTQRRVERAKELLAESPLPLVHVASAVGFQTQGHFTEVFRRHTRTTPRRFRLAALAPAARAAPPASSMED